MLAKSPHRNSRLVLHISPRQDPVLRGAAKLANKSLADFILDSAYQVAELAVLDGKDTQTFVELIDRPAQDNPDLKDFLRHSAPWQD